MTNDRDLWMSIFESIYRFFGWWIINIDFFLVLLLILAAGLFWLQRKKWGKRLLIISCAGFVFLGIVPIGLWSFETLENRFPKVAQIPTDVKGIILLGGPFDKLTTIGRGEAAYNLTLGRFIRVFEIAKENPQLQLVFAGSHFENEMAKKEFRALGLDPESILFPDSSNNTKENAAHTAIHLDPKPGEKWLLVTSAYHMPRSVGLFRKAGFDVIPYPVDYHAPGHYEMWFFIGLKMNLDAWHAIAREWLGMVVNYMMGRSSEIYPGPLTGN